MERQTHEFQYQHKAGLPQRGIAEDKAEETHLVDCLDTLIHTCDDGEYGFRRCAAQAQAMPLQWLLTQRVQSYRKSIAELQAMRIKVVGAAAHTPSTNGARRSWVAPDRRLAGFGDLALLAECERGEDWTLRRYRSVLDEDLPILLRAIAQRQCDVAQSQRAQMRRMHAALLSEEARAVGQASSENQQTRRRGRR